MKIIKLLLVILSILMIFLGVSKHKLSSEIKEMNEVINKQSETINKQNEDIENKNREIEELNTKFKESEEGNAIIGWTPIVDNYSNGQMYLSHTINENPTYLTMTLVGYNTDSYNESSETIDFSGERGPTAKVTIVGTLYNFKIAVVSWNDDMSEYTIVEEITSFDEIENKTITFNSMLAEHFPSELIIWEDENGEQKYYPIYDDGYGFQSKVILCENYTEQ